MSERRKIAGVLGGMGPDATLDFMARVLAETSAADDQHHIRMLVDHNPGVPSRQAALAGDGESPGPVLAAMAAGLERHGADFLVMPCNTAHAFRKDILGATRIPFIDIVDEAVAAGIAAHGAARRFGVLATAGCLEANLYQEALDEAGREAVLPTSAEATALTASAVRIKAGARAEEWAILRSLALALAGRGADVVIVACTEIPLVLSSDDVSVPLVCSTTALARKTVALACGRLPLPERSGPHREAACS